MFSEPAMDWLRRALGGTTDSLRFKRMQGATSSALYLLEREAGAATQRFVLRVIANPAWLAEEPDSALHEAAALAEARCAGLPAPECLAYSLEDVGFGAPVVLMSFLEGAIELRPTDVARWAEELAQTLAAIHRHPAEGFPWRFESWVDAANVAPPVWTTVPALWERAIDLWRQGEPDAPRVFLHRDYHPMNVLWSQGKVRGIVDWISACRGQAGAEVGYCRSDLALMAGVERADQFLAAYLRAADGVAYAPYWDIDALLDKCLPEPTFYAPWQEFGLSYISPETLRQRTDAYLISVLRRV